MQVELNSVWAISGLDGFVDGKYRVLRIYPDDKIVILFPVIEARLLRRPLKIGCEEFVDAIKSGVAQLSLYELPYYQLQADDEIPVQHKAKRDERYQLIVGLVIEPNFLLDLVQQERSKMIANHARKIKSYVQVIYRTLNNYWMYGQEINALLPRYSNSGGRGKARVARGKKRGSPIQLSSHSLDAPIGVNTTESDKNIFVKAMKEYGLNGNKVRYSRVYDKMLKEYYAEEQITAELESREALLPSYRTFIYWIKKLIPAQTMIRNQTNKGFFDRNNRGLIGSATDHTEVPGSCFELDSTVLDVHVVSEFQRNHVLGRPTVYCVIDKESRMIVGLHVSMEYASWRAGRQALINSFTSKKSFCSQFGIQIEESDWPCNHIPQRLLCDRGEFVCSDAEKLAVPLIGHLSIAPPYRADLKAIVERRFKILNERLVHDLLGTTKGRHYIRGDRDPRMDAVLTLREITTLLIDEVLDHNSSLFQDLAKQSTLLIESGLPPTPLNYWNQHILAHRHALSRADEAHVRARLLPNTKVTMTSKGVRLNDQMFYTSEHPDFDAWKVIARNNGSWSLEARLDHDNSSFIYVRFDPECGFIRCELMKESANFSNRHQADILYFADWLKLEKKKHKPTIQSIERHQRRQAVINNAKEQAALAPKLETKSEKIKGMKARRRADIDARRLGEVDDIVSNVDIPKKVINITQNNISIFKRTKGDDDAL